MLPELYQGDVKPLYRELTCLLVEQSKENVALTHMFVVLKGEDYAPYHKERRIKTNERDAVQSLPSSYHYEET